MRLSGRCTRTRGRSCISVDSDVVSAVVEGLCLCSCVVMFLSSPLNVSFRCFYHPPSLHTMSPPPNFTQSECLRCCCIFSLRDPRRIHNCMFIPPSMNRYPLLTFSRCKCHTKVIFIAVTSMCSKFDVLYVLRACRILYDVWKHGLNGPRHRGLCGKSATYLQLRGNVGTMPPGRALSLHT